VLNISYERRPPLDVVAYEKVNGGMNRHNMIMDPFGTFRNFSPELQFFGLD
jgi:hypothetical protein